MVDRFVRLRVVPPPPPPPESRTFRMRRGPAFLPAHDDRVAARVRLTRVRPDHHDAVTLTLAAQALEESGRAHAGCTAEYCVLCWWLSKGIAAVREARVL